MAKTNRLGKGLSALIPDKQDETTPSERVGTLTEIEVAKIRANPYQPRLRFDKERLDELRESIQQNGVIQPITVRSVDDRYELIAGERRLKAVAELGHSYIPAYIVAVDSKEEMLQFALIENVQREKLDFIELANAYQRLIEECHMTQDDLSHKIGKDRTTIANTVRLLKLPKEIQQSVQQDEISMGHARSLLSLSEPSVQKTVWKQIVKRNLSVRKTEKLVKEAVEGVKKSNTQKPRRSVYMQKVEDDLRETLGTKVNVRPKKEGGVIEVEFYSPEDLNRLLEIFETINTE
ncbi:MAG: ParB/RepB/Spo0J family partition protein [Caldithrix sp.]|nr:ParB/RepB/Spo0J family partition protein [Caldithrix sp.]